MNDRHPTVLAVNKAFCEQAGRPFEVIDAWHFCDKRQDADDCAALVLSGEKRATSPSLWWYEQSGEALPKAGDVNIITNWAGEAQCVIQTLVVDICAYNKISEAYAFLEGEGDKSLAYWQAVHWPYYQRELEPFGLQPQVDMPIVCEHFELVFRP
ncbi:ASCH domain-containing protein [Pseudoteredinibacter isoporae]|uniref:ASCH domain-containing protein n=1 Tax=Pseudoteredinibacter isoporae TaxID=570281 RepID=UPI00333F8514